MFFRLQSLFVPFQNHVIKYPTPINLTYLWGFGSLAGLFLVSQLLTGIFLAMHYTAHVDLAFASLEHIMRDVNSGWFIRYLHANGASLFFFLVYCHIGRTLYFGYYTKARLYLWLSGILIFFLMMAIAFMGYVLPWGQMSFWGATVITNLFTALPLIGEQIAYWLWGGFSVSNATLTRFFSFHYCLPFILVAIIVLHLILLHVEGSMNPSGLSDIPDRLDFYPYFYVKDYFGFLVCCSGIFLIISYYPDILGHPDNYIEANALVTPAHIVPEWYFLPFYAILRAVPNKLGGVVLMFFSIAILTILPFLQVSQRTLFLPARIFYSWCFWIFAFSVIFLGILGGLPIESPYTETAQLLSGYYFFFFTFLIMFDYLLTREIFSSISHQLEQLSTPKNSMHQQPTPTPATLKSNPGYISPGFSTRVTINKNKAFKNKAFVNWLKVSLNRVKKIHSVSYDVYTTGLQRGLSPTVYKRVIHNHPYHLVNASPWPFVASMSLLAITMGGVLYMHQMIAGSLTVIIGFFSFLFCLFVWFRDVIREGTFEGQHTLRVQQGLKAGMLLFIISEIMFFFSFFWGFFHSSLSPSIQIGGVWPPMGIGVFNPWEIPLLNTLILLTSGVSVTWAHYAIRENNRFLTVSKWRKHYVPAPMGKRYSLQDVRNKIYVEGHESVDKDKDKVKAQHMARVKNRIVLYLDAGPDVIKYYRQHKDRAGLKKNWINEIFNDKDFIRKHSVKASFFNSSRQDLLVALSITILLGLIFTVIQYYEYKHATFTISDSVYGSTFFLTTGFHGIHVIIGTFFLGVCFVRALFYHFTLTHHIGLESAIWYWHFVDVVWLGLYISIYHWGGSAVI